MVAAPVVVVASVVVVAVSGGPAWLAPAVAPCALADSPVLQRAADFR